uniref:NADH-ubiquinone oxidoreductase chain 4 n=1 Tax=Histeromerus sp. QL-2013 TaxID=1421637 RepID=A0A0A6ZLM0_9HYME|nr:NADH dehydrogenase subunit 4 [Histeromerus sp. QL-2013]
MMKFILLILSMNFVSFFLNKYLFIMIIQNILMLTSFMMIINNNFLNYYWMKIYYNMGMDNISFGLIILVIWILNLSMIASNNLLLNKFNINFLNIMIFLMLILILSFTSMNMMSFYIFFETSLIPIMMLIMGWGYQTDRIQASMYMIFYTLFGSLPLLIMLMFMYFKFNSLMFNILYLNNNSNVNNLFFYIILTSAFFIKMPMYLVHLWLPKAHVEAPISGSMILAGIMLKLGSYGLYRSMIIFPMMFLKFNLYFIMLSLMGSIYTSLICLNQMDMKIIVAYSSVVHMGLLIASMLTMSSLSFKGSFLLMISHGLCSSGMFFLLNLVYERLSSRNMLISKGLLSIMPSLTLWWFLLCSSNFSAPPSLNLISELMLFNSLIQWNKFLILILFFISFFSTCYSIYLYSFTQYGKFNLILFNFKLINCREYLILILHWVPLNLLFLNLNIFL